MAYHECLNAQNATQVPVYEYGMLGNIVVHFRDQHRAIIINIQVVSSAGVVHRNYEMEKRLPSFLLVSS
jgi:hypothetical protein